MKVLSHGGGVQTRTLLRLALEGGFERPDLVIFADTGAEPEEVYQAIDEDRAACEAAGVPFQIVSHGDLGATDEWGGVFIPAFTLNERGDRGMLRRQCTDAFKVGPIHGELRRRGASSQRPSELWLGISTDEAHRMKRSRVGYIENRWPLVELGMSREDCVAFLTARDITPTKSACVFCPYRSPEEWRRIRANPADFNAAVDYDRELRHQRPAGGELYVHASRLPLDEAPIEDDSAQGDLWGNECGGYCGL